MTATFIPREHLYRRIHELQHQAHGEGFRQGQQDGLKRGHQQGAATIVLLCLEQKLGPLDTELRDWITRLSLTDLKALAKQLPQVDSLATLEAWLTSRQI